ncbi:exopolysaccharide biosynthesis protein [Roseovarius sp. SYSU LYC5161]|uniref:exopolysaccharide biosynthesis protein n=1 Tax=Roseovarius halophilus (ex Wu et al. 2025) TaxID=3376060 RepID=UPI00399BA205
MPGLKSDSSLTDMLDLIASEMGDGHVSLRDIMRILGARSLTPLLLVPCIALVSPLSAVPGLPTLLAAVVGLVSLQLLTGRRRLWLPRVLLDRSLHVARLARVLAVMRPTVVRVDRLINERLTLLTDRPWNLPALCLFCIVSFFMPLIEFVPFLTSTLASALALFAVALFARDGLLMLAGYALVGVAALLVVKAVGFLV